MITDISTILAIFKFQATEGDDISESGCNFSDIKEMIEDRFFKVVDGEIVIDLGKDVEGAA